MKARNHSALRRAASAAIETLESRRLLSTVTIVDNGDGTSTLKVVGTSGKDWVSVYDDPIGNIVEVFDDKNRNSNIDAGELSVFTGENIKVVDVETKGSDDRVGVELTSDLEEDERSYNIDLGSGNDLFDFYVPTAPDNNNAGNLTFDPDGANIVDSDVVFDVDGSSGNDDIYLDFALTSIVCSSVIIGIDADTGNDTVTLEAPDVSALEIQGCFEFDTPITEPLDGEAVFDDTPAVLQVEVNLDSGNDVMNLNNRAALINAVFNINVDGQGGKDTFNDFESFGLFSPDLFNTLVPIDTDDLGSRLTVTANLGSQDDQYNADFAFGEDDIVDRLVGGEGFPIQIDNASEARFNIQGGSEKDKLEIDDVNIGFDRLIPENNIDGLLEIQMYGGTGNDTVAIDIDPGPVLNVGSTGVLRWILSGDSGSDKVLLDARVSEFSEGQYDIALLGGSGNDSLGAAFQNDNLIDNTANHYGPRRYILLDGGLGSDKWDTEGNGIFKLRSVETLLESLQGAFGV